MKNAFLNWVVAVLLFGIIGGITLTSVLEGGLIAASMCAVASILLGHDLIKRSRADMTILSLTSIALSILLAVVILLTGEMWTTGVGWVSLIVTVSVSVSIAYLWVRTPVLFRDREFHEFNPMLIWGIVIVFHMTAASLIAIDAPSWIIGMTIGSYVFIGLVVIAVDHAPYWDSRTYVFTSLAMTTVYMFASVGTLLVGDMQSADILLSLQITLISGTCIITASYLVRTSRIYIRRK